MQISPPHPIEMDFSQTNKNVDNNKNFILGIIVLSLSMFYAVFEAVLSSNEIEFIFPGCKILWGKIIWTKLAFIITSIVGLFFEFWAFFWIVFKRKSLSQKFADIRIEGAYDSFKKGDYNAYEERIKDYIKELKEFAIKLKRPQSYAIIGFILLLIDCLCLFLSKLLNLK